MKREQKRQREKAGQIKREKDEVERKEGILRERGGEGGIER